jgi:hypothetical protein
MQVSHRDAVAINSASVASTLWSINPRKAENVVKLYASLAWVAGPSHINELQE